MTIAFIIILSILIIISFLPSTRITHWSARIFDYVRIQVLILSLLVLGVSFFVIKNITTEIIALQLGLGLAMIHQLSVILPYFPIPYFRKTKITSEYAVSVLSSNVLQSNDQYQNLIDLVDAYQPDILLTMETNKAWEKAMQPVEKQLPYGLKAAYENRYGMHLYTKLKVHSIKEHAFLVDDRPAIEAHLEDENSHRFVFWGFHPPPPSPTEKPSSRQKDSELMQLAKLIKNENQPTIVVGDFNTVCWSRSSKLFGKVSQLEDGRKGRGIRGTFPVRPNIFRFPIDLIFSSPEIHIKEIDVLQDIGSDHLPVYATFWVTSSNKLNHKPMDSSEEKDAEEIIAEGEKAVGEEE